MELALEDLADGEGFVDGRVFWGEEGWGGGGVGEEGGWGGGVGTWGGIGEVEVEVEVGLVDGVAEVAVDEVVEELFLDGGGDEGGEDEEAWGGCQLGCCGVGVSGLPGRRGW